MDHFTEDHLATNAEPRYVSSTRDESAPPDILERHALVPSVRRDDQLSAVSAAGVSAVGASVETVGGALSSVDS